MYVFFNDTATTEIYTLSLHDALPIWCARLFGTRQFLGEFALDQQFIDAALGNGQRLEHLVRQRQGGGRFYRGAVTGQIGRATSELQSCQYLVCRLLLEKKNISLILLS